MAKEPVETSVEESSEADEAQAQADFDAGAASVTGPEGSAKLKEPERDENGRFVPKQGEEKPTATAKPEAGKPADAKPEYVQLTKQQLERLEAAANRTDDFEKQFSKVFGTVGDMQKIVRTLQSQTPRGTSVTIPDGAFADLEKDFPDLAPHVRKVFEATLKGLEGTGSASAHVDMEALETKVTERALKLASEDLADEFPDWQKIVGAVDVRRGEKPDPNNPFRKWLATKDKAYQDKVNGANSAGVITRAIRAFQSDTKAPPKKEELPNKRTQARSDRIQDAVRPKGDGGQPPAKNAEDEFEAGFKSG